MVLCSVWFNYECLRKSKFLFKILHKYRCLSRIKRIFHLNLKFGLAQTTQKIRRHSNWVEILFGREFWRVLLTFYFYSPFEKRSKNWKKNKKHPLEIPGVITLKSENPKNKYWCWSERWLVRCDVGFFHIPLAYSKRIFVK